jgi:hypothetical protein
LASAAASLRVFALGQEWFFLYSPSNPLFELRFPFFLGQGLCSDPIKVSRLFYHSSFSLIRVFAMWGPSLAASGLPGRIGLYCTSPDLLILGASSLCGHVEPYHVSPHPRSLPRLPNSSAGSSFSRYLTFPNPSNPSNPVLEPAVTSSCDSLCTVKYLVHCPPQSRSVRRRPAVPPTAPA